MQEETRAYALFWKDSNEKATIYKLPGEISRNSFDHFRIFVSYERAKNYDGVGPGNYCVIVPVKIIIDKLQQVEDKLDRRE